jgi:hypothetical protein
VLLVALLIDEVVLVPPLPPDPLLPVPVAAVPPSLQPEPLLANPPITARVRPSAWSTERLLP